MSTTRKIAHNTATQIIGKAVSTVLAVITVGVITRSVGASGFGIFTTATAFLQFFGLAVDFGLTLTLASLFGNPATDRKKVLSAALGFRLVSGILFFGAAPLVALLFPYPPEIKTGIALAAPAFLATAFTQLLSALFQANLRMDKVAIAELAGRVALLLGVIVSNFLGGGLSGIFIALVAGNVINALLALLYAHPFTPINFSFAPKEWLLLLKYSWPIAVSMALNLIYLRADVLILSLFRTQEEVGLYGAAYRVIDVLTTFPILFMGLVLPLLSGAWFTDKKRFYRIYQKSFDALTLLGLPVVFGVFALGKNIMTFMAGPEFSGSGEILNVLIVALFFLFVGALPLHTVVAIEKQKKILWAFAASAALSLVLYFLLIPSYGVVAAAGITLFSECFVTICAAALVWRETKIKISLKISSRALLSAILMGVVGIILRQIHVLIAVSVCAVLYFGLLLVSRAITPEILRELLKLRAKKPEQQPSN